MHSTWPLVKRWTNDDHERLKTLAASGMRADEIASVLSRSEKAVRARAWQHNIPLRIRATKSPSRKPPQAKS